MVLLTKNFKFKDGVYYSHTDLQMNSPSLSWDSLYSRLHTNPQNLTTLVDTIAHRSALPLKKIWGFSLGGIPYVNLNQRNKAGLQKYAGLRVRGNICFFSSSETYKEPQMITAYNPRTGVPFRQGEVMTNKVKEKRYMLSFETGAITDFTASNFVEWIQEDAQMIKTVKNLNDEEREEKLFKCLLIYDDRNPVYVPVARMQ